MHTYIGLDLVVGFESYNGGLSGGAVLTFYVGAGIASGFQCKCDGQSFEGEVNAGAKRWLRRCREVVGARGELSVKLDIADVKKVKLQRFERDVDVNINLEYA